MRNDIRGVGKTWPNITKHYQRNPDYIHVTIVPRMAPFIIIPFTRSGGR